MAKKITRQSEKRSAGRPRDTQATDAVLSAALELGLEEGFEALTIEGVAAHAGVAKTTIYRRWPNIWSVVADAVLADVGRTAPLQERASARESLRASMRLAAKYFRGRHGQLLGALIGRSQVDPTLQRELIDRWLLARRNVTRRFVAEGIASGEIRRGLSVDLVIDALYGPLYHHLLLPYDPKRPGLTDAYVDALIDAVFKGVERR